MALGPDRMRLQGELAHLLSLSEQGRPVVTGQLCCYNPLTVSWRSWPACQPGCVRGPFCSEHRVLLRLLRLPPVTAWPLQALDQPLVPSPCVLARGCVSLCIAAAAARPCVVSGGYFSSFISSSGVRECDCPLS